jgi:hypothetical protein
MFIRDQALHTAQASLTAGAGTPRGRTLPLLKAQYSDRLGAHGRSRLSGGVIPRILIAATVLPNPEVPMFAVRDPEVRLAEYLFPTGAPP